MTREQRAGQIWPLLTLSASLRMTLTYKRVGELIGALPVSIGGWLEPIQSYCLIHELPPLTVLVVGEADGMPGLGFSGGENVPAAQTRVFRHDWTQSEVPTPDELARALAERPSHRLRSAAEKPNGGDATQ